MIKKITLRKKGYFLVAKIGLTIFKECYLSFRTTSGTSHGIYLGAHQQNIILELSRKTTIH